MPIGGPLTQQAIEQALMMGLDPPAEVRSGEEPKRHYPTIGRGTLIGGNVLDAISTEMALASGNGQEANPLMQGSPWKRLALKGAGTAAGEFLFNKLSKSGHDKAATILSALLGGTLGGIGVNNLRIANK